MAHANLIDRIVELTGAVVRADQDVDISGLVMPNQNVTVYGVGFALSEDDVDLYALNDAVIKLLSNGPLYDNIIYFFRDSHNYVLGLDCFTISALIRRL